MQDSINCAKNKKTPHIKDCCAEFSFGLIISQTCDSPMHIFFIFMEVWNFFSFAEFYKNNVQLRCGKNHEFPQMIMEKYREFSSNISETNSIRIN